MGLKPSDCASVQGRADTAEFLVMFETALGVSDISQSEAFIITIDQSEAFILTIDQSGDPGAAGPGEERGKRRQRGQRHQDQLQVSAILLMIIL